MGCQERNTKTECFRKRELEKTGSVGRDGLVLGGGAKNAERVEDEPRGWRQGLELSPSQSQPSLGGRNLLTAVPRGPKHHPLGCRQVGLK